MKNSWVTKASDYDWDWENVSAEVTDIEVAKRFFEVGQDRLSGQVALVTGGGRGIGRMSALALAGEGAAVVVLARSQGQIDETAGIIYDLGGRCLSILCDVVDLSQLQKATTRAVEEYGKLSIVLVNAGTNLDRNQLLASDPVGFEQTIRVNLLGAYYTAYAVAPELVRAGGGHLIFVESGLGINPSPGMLAYGASKAGVHQMVTSYARELCDYKITVNGLNPGPTATELTAPLRVPGQEKGVFAEPNSWVKHPAYVAKWVRDMACWVPGQCPSGQTYDLKRAR
ncbi:MAG TPA: SDR family oxidoreductase [Candidatus Wirthbacteria bacterium]|mgnify:CR=1 FL=1|nr:SDR family oxidoreductase [Candidatus Wirthbacteria bacterium]